MQVKFFASLGDIKNGKLLNRRSGERNGFMACTVLVSASRNRGYNVQLTLNNLYLCIWWNLTLHPTVKCYFSSRAWGFLIWSCHCLVVSATWGSSAGLGSEGVLGSKRFFFSVRLVELASSILLKDLLGFKPQTYYQDYLSVVVIWSKRGKFLKPTPPDHQTIAQLRIRRTL